MSGRHQRHGPAPLKAPAHPVVLTAEPGWSGPRAMTPGLPRNRSASVQLHLRFARPTPRRLYRAAKVEKPVQPALSNPRSDRLEKWRILFVHPMGSGYNSSHVTRIRFWPVRSRFVTAFRLPSPVRRPPMSRSLWWNALCLILATALSGIGLGQGSGKPFGKLGAKEGDPPVKEPLSRRTVRRRRRWRR